LIRFLDEESKRVPGGWCLNLGSAARVIAAQAVNIDLRIFKNVDIQADIARLPIRSQTIDTIVCTGVLEHVSDCRRAIAEMARVLKPGGRFFLETAFMQTVHGSPQDYYRWTPEGLKRLIRPMKLRKLGVVAGPASALAWVFQEVMAMLLSFHSDLLYRVNLRLFGWLAVTISWFDILLERHPMAAKAASGFSLVAEKKRSDDRVPK
jgi:SAM-dependent methyltransferase